MPLRKSGLQILANSATPHVVYSFPLTYTALSPLPAAGHRPAGVTAPVILCWATPPGTLPPKSQRHLIYTGFVSLAVLPCLPLCTTPLITCRLWIMRTLVTQNTCKLRFPVMRVISWGLPEDCRKKKDPWEKLFLFQVCLASLRKKLYRPLLMYEVISAKSAFQLKL